MRKALAYLKEITNFHFIWCLVSCEQCSKIFRQNLLDNLIQGETGSAIDDCEICLKFSNFVQTTGEEEGDGKGWKQLRVRKKEFPKDSVMRSRKGVVGVWGVGGRKGVRQRKVSDVSGPKCGGCSTEGLRAWEQERGKNRNATPETAFAPPTNNQNVEIV